MSITPINVGKTSNPNGTPKQIYELYDDIQIDPSSPDSIETTYDVAGGVGGANIYPRGPGNDIGVAAAIHYQNHLQNDVAKRESINNDINSQLQFTMMAMTIWVPLGIFAGYYLYNKGA